MRHRDWPESGPQSALGSLGSHWVGLGVGLGRQFGANLGASRALVGHFGGPLGRA